MEKIFYRINNTLICLGIFFIGFILLGELSPANSAFNVFDRYFAEDTALPAVTNNTSTPAYIINKTVDLRLDSGNFSVKFLSDGKNGDANKDSIGKYFSKDGAPAEITPISTTLNFNFKKGVVTLPGEFVYPAIRTITAPSNYVCNEQTSKDDKNCLIGVTSLSVWTSGTTSRIVLDDGTTFTKQGKQGEKISIKSSGDWFSQFVKILDESIGDFIVTNVGLPDQSRSAIGTVHFWGDDELQQYAIIAYKQGSGTEPQVKQAISTTAVNRDQDYSAIDLSPGLNSSIFYKIHVNVDKYASDPGVGNISDPFVKKQSSRSDNADVTFSDIVKAFLSRLSGKPDEAPKQDQEKLSVHVALRSVNDSDTFGVGYRFCQATNSLTEWSSDNMESRKLPGTNVESPTSPRYIYEHNVSSSDKKCLNAIEKYQGLDKAKGCAENLINGRSCDEFSVEESNMRFYQKEKTLPIGLGAYFQNSTLNELDPNVEGPFINYLSPYYCAKLDMVYEITPGEDHIYDIRANTVKGEKMKGEKKLESKKTIEVNNQSCVLGGLLSNFSWAIYQQQNNFSSKNSADLINLPKEGLTCDKKETAIFGANFVNSNIPAPNDKLIYINEDNSRGALVAEDVLVNHGYNPYSLSDIINEVKAPIYKYTDHDIRTIVGLSGKPEYVMFITQRKDERDENQERKLMLCRINGIPSRLGKSASNGQNLCIELEKHKRLFLNGYATFIRNTNGDSFIAVVEFEPNDDPDKAAENINLITVKLDSTDFSSSRKNIVKTRIQSGKVDKFEIVTQNDGNIGVLMSKRDDTSRRLSILKFVNVDPIAAYDNGSNNNSTGSKGKTIDYTINNLCDAPNRAYCTYISDPDYDMKLMYDSTSGLTFAAAVGNGTGVIFPIGEAFSSINPLGSIFSYSKKSGSFVDNEDLVSAMKYESVSGEFHVFMQKSGYYLRVLSPYKVNVEEIKSNALQKCGGNNCLITVQYEFNPHLFKSDCSDYFGTGGTCIDPHTKTPFPKMDALGNPIVKEFTFTGGGKIHAWYKYSRLDETIFESKDMLYAYSGVYTQVNGDEYSNVYVPSAKTLIGGTVNVIVATPIRYFNYSSGGLKIGRELENHSNSSEPGNKDFKTPNEYVTEVIQVMRPDKYRCYQNFSKVTGIDLYFSDTGLTPVNTNPIQNPSPSDTTGFSGTNPGEYCEETWCVPDTVPIVNNPRFRTEEAKEKSISKIKEFFATQGTQGERQYESKLNLYDAKTRLMCNKAAEAGIPCALLGAIWYQESGGSLNENVPLGCFGEAVYCALDETTPQKDDVVDPYRCKHWREFDVQVDCAIGSLKSSQNHYANNETLSGPGSIYTPNKGISPVPKGSCKPATLFSMAMQRYTPSDKRTNFNNQCNKGLVLRDDQGACVGDGLVQGAESDNVRFDASQTSGEWPRGNLIEMRPRLQKALKAMDVPELTLYPENKSCFPSGNDPLSPLPSNIEDIEKAKRDYEVTKYTGVVGRFKMNLAGWGRDDAAGYVYMALKEDWRNPGGNTLSQTEPPVKIEGAHIIQPGQRFSFNDNINNSIGNIVEGLKSKYSKIKTPWNDGGFVFDGSSVVGGGWCELATTIRMAAGRVQGLDGRRLSAIPFSGREDASPVPDTSYGTSSGYKGQINHWTHSGVSIDSFNLKLSVGNEYKLKPEDRNSYIAIWERYDKHDGFNDADLELVNPYPVDSGMSMIVAVWVDDKGVITAEVYFGKKAASAPTTNPTSTPTPQSQINVYQDRKRYV